MTVGLHFGGTDEESELGELKAVTNPLIALINEVVSDKIEKVLRYNTSRTGDEQINIKECAKVSKEKFCLEHER